MFGESLAHAQSFPIPFSYIPPSTIGLGRNTPRRILDWLFACDCELLANHNLEAGFSIWKWLLRVSGAAAGEVCVCRSEGLCVEPGFVPLRSPLKARLQFTEEMGGIRFPAHMFLWSLSAVYMFAFASLYVQIPGEVFTSALLKIILQKFHAEAGSLDKTVTQ